MDVRTHQITGLSNEDSACNPFYWPDGRNEQILRRGAWPEASYERERMERVRRWRRADRAPLWPIIPGPKGAEDRVPRQGCSVGPRSARGAGSEVWQGPARGDLLPVRRQGSRRKSHSTFESLKFRGCFTKLTRTSKIEGSAAIAIQTERGAL